MNGGEGHSSAHNMPPVASLNPQEIQLLCKYNDDTYCIYFKYYFVIVFVEFFSKPSQFLGTWVDCGHRGWVWDHNKF